MQRYKLSCCPCPLSSLNCSGIEQSSDSTQKRRKQHKGEICIVYLLKTADGSITFILVELGWVLLREGISLYYSIAPTSNGLPEVVNKSPGHHLFAWNIIIQRNYLSFIWNSNLTGLPVFHRGFWCWITQLSIAHCCVPRFASQVCGLLGITLAPKNTRFRGELAVWLNQHKFNVVWRGLLYIRLDNRLQVVKSIRGPSS